MATFVLIHGAFRGGWAWQRVRRLLQADGHQVFAPSLTGAGERAHLCDAGITLETWVNDVTALLEAEDLRDVMLVGHSQGGVVITAASEHCAERLSHLVYLDAPVPQDGQAAVDLVPQEIRARCGEPPRDAIAQPIAVRAGEEFSEDEAAWMNARLTPMPVRPSFDVVRLTNPQALALPRTYIFCEGTPEFFPSVFTRRRFDAEGVAYRTLAAGHDVMLSQPEMVAALLRELAK